MTPILDVGLHQATVCGQVIIRPQSVSLKEWLEFWSDLSNSERYKLGFDAGYDEGYNDWKHDHEGVHL